MVDRKHSIFIGPLFLGFHRHDVINKYVSKEKEVDKYVLHEENYIFLWWKH